MSAKKTMEEVIDGLAIAVQQGFEDVLKRISSVKEDTELLREEMKTEFKNVREEMRIEFKNVRSEMKTEFRNVRDEMKTGFESVEFRSTDLDPRVTALEQKMKIVSAKLGFQ